MPGYASIYRYSRERQFGYAVLVNDSDSWGTPGGINKVINDYLFAGDPRPLPPPPRAPQPPANLAAWAGHYQLAAPEVEFLRFHTDVYAGVDLAVTEGALWLINPRKSRIIQLVPTGPDTFRHPREIGSSIQLTRDGAGRQVVVVGQTYYEKESAGWAAARRWALELSLLLLLSTGWIPIFFLLRREREEVAVLVRPLLAALCLLGMVVAFSHARETGDLGVCNATTIGVWVLSWAFGLLSYSALGNMRHASPEVPRPLRLYAFAVSAAAVWVAMHLSRYGLIGLRTWRW
jgi:hypothetical protein